MVARRLTHTYIIESLSSRSFDLPRHIRDADLTSRLLIIVEPVALGEIDFVKRGIRLHALGLPHTLLRSQHFEDMQLLGGIVTSGLNSTNSRPLQSMVMMFCGLGGLCWGYTLGASIMLAVCCLYSSDS